MAQMVADRGQGRQPIFVDAVAPHVYHLGMNAPTRRPLPLKAIGLWVTIIAIPVIAGAYFLRPLSPDAVAAKLSLPIWAKWQQMPAMKLAEVKKVTLTRVGTNTLTGTVEFKIGGLVDSVPIDVVADPFNLDWTTRPAEPIREMRFKQYQVLVSHSVDDGTAKAFGEWMTAQGHFDEPGSSLLRKAGDRYVLHVGVKPGTEANTALLYTPKKEHTRYLVDFELDALAEQVRCQASTLGIAQVSDLIAVTDGGNGLEEALQRHLADNLTTILDWYHAAEHLCDFAKVWHSRDEPARTQWQHEAKEILYEQGGEALLKHLQAVELPPHITAEVHEELRKLIGYFENNRHRTDYPTYRSNGWDIGSGPTEAGCKIIGERLKGSGMRWVEAGAATVAALRALYVSGSNLWDGFWSQPHRAAA